tara:strand:- start:31 stop:210 length:180 start_codon:yes stop_codon:yes gene_type:complete
MGRIAGIRLGVDLTGLESLKGPMGLRDIQSLVPLRAADEVRDLEDLKNLQALKRLRFVV